MQNNYTVLFDFDSLIYKAVYRIVSFGQIRFWLQDGKDRAWIEQEILNLAINRLSNMADNICVEIDDTGINIVGVEYFVTHCKNSFRKKLSPIYKANRKKTRISKWVSMVRKEVLKMEFAISDDTHEADDLVKDRAVEIGKDRFIIATMDKDLQQIPGVHFDYYRPPAKGEIDTMGLPVVHPCRGLKVVTEKEAERFFWFQMLAGDPSDNIKGVPRIGKIKAEKILNESNGDFEKAVFAAYEKKFEGESKA